MAQTIVRVAVPRPLYRLFDYELPPHLPVPAPGCRVRVPFGRSHLTGICVESKRFSGLHRGAGAERPLKPLHAVIDTAPLIDTALLALLRWAADYYHHPLGETLFTALPGWLRDGRPTSSLHRRRWSAASDAVPDALPPGASRLRACLGLLLQHGCAVDEHELRTAGFDARTLRTLQQRGLAVVCESPPAVIGRRRDNGQRSDGALVLTPMQQQALTAIAAGAHGFHCYLLDGVTGSGKTEVYLRTLSDVLAAGTAAQALVLIPEIALTPQTMARFEARFGAVAGYHSGLSERERARIWDDCRNGQVQVLIGTRSAVFAPFQNLRLIIVDEEHDGSFKQQEGLRYSARDLAVKRAREIDIPLVLGSATPSLESLRNATLGRYQHLHLPERTNGAPAPRLKLIDIRGMQLRDGIGPPLAQSITQHLAAGNQVLLFINRRGYAPSLMCTSCGWRPGCEGCDLPLTVHRHRPGLRCHHCGRRQPLPAACAQCGARGLLPVGHGTQRTETAVGSLFPGYPVIRIDRDSVRHASELAAHFDHIQQGRPAILVGTQMLAKGHHFPRVTLVGVLNADAGLFSTDFRAPEHTAQLIIQVAGRAGRAEHPGEVWIQTYNPEHPLLRALAEQGYQGFTRTELRQRESAGLPPARHLAVLRAEAPGIDAALQCLQHLTAELRTDGGVLPAPAALHILGPAPAPMVKKSNRFRAQCLLISATRRVLHGALDRIVAAHGERRTAGVRWHIDVDPYDLS
jgi:primosomal protein N' (replication factor Y) (superfamily II helicase)